MNKNEISFFLGANSADGFFSLFDEIYDADNNWRGYIIKGGPGTGKSGLMRKVATGLENAGYTPLWIYCSSDSDSLDAIIFPELKFFMLDGTSPHTVDPKYPGVSENIANLGLYWNKEKLKESKEEIIKYSNLCSDFHKQSDRFLAATGMLQKDSYNMVLPMIDLHKLESYAKRLMIGKTKSKEKNGTILNESHKAFLSGITPKGVMFFENTVTNLCDTVYIIDDNYGVVSDLLLKSIAKQAKKLDLATITCNCPLFAKDKLEHVLIPELGLAFLTSNYSSEIKIDAERRINSNRFIDQEKLKNIKARLRFNKKASLELLNEAVELQKSAKLVHDELEKCYIKNMDFAKIDALANDIIDELI